MYILRCADGTLYTGITTDLTRRVREHNGSPRGAAYTRGRRPVTLVWHVAATDRREAGARESAVRRLRRGAKERLVATASGGQGDAQGVHLNPTTDRG